MVFQQKDNSGALFRNDKRDKETQPNYRGDLLVEGIAFEISAWLKDGKNGKFMSLAVKRKEARPAQSRDNARPVERNSYDDPFDDPNDLPF